MSEKRQEGQDLERWLSLRAEARKEGKLGAPVSLEDFKFLLSQGGHLTEEDVPHIDNYYLSRLEIRVERDRKVYRFKTLTTEKGEFYVPF